KKNLKRRSIILGLAAVLIIAIIGGYFVWSYYIGHPSAAQVRDMTMAYIKAHHKETAQYMQSFTWIGGPAYLEETGVASGSVNSLRDGFSCQKSRDIFLGVNF